jgi:hypothetical protein
MTEKRRPAGFTRYGLSSTLVAFGLLSGFSALASAPAEAACTLPNQISNGQIADATAVMGDFNALANCATSTTGSPTNGSIAVFSGGTSVTSGNLTGDVTTSGSTTTSLASSGVTPGTYDRATITVDAKGRVIAASNIGPSGVAPGTYSNATITVDATGRVTAALSGNGAAGSGGKPWYWNPSLAASVTYAGYDGNSPTLADDSDVGLQMTWSVPISGDRQRILYRSLTTPTGDFDWKFHGGWMNPNINWAAWIIGLRDSVSGKEVFGVAYNGNLAATEIRTLTGFTGAGTTVGTGYGIPLTLPTHVRWAKSGTNITFYESIDGKNWVQLYTTTTTALGFTPNQVFFGVSYNRSTGIPITGFVDRFDLSGTAV